MKIHMPALAIWKRDGNQKVKTVVPESLNAEMQKADLSEYVLHVEDRHGERYLFRIFADQLVGEEGVVIGRNPPDSAYAIDRSDVSRQHVRMKLVKGRLFVEDLNTTNGTTINGRSINRMGWMSLKNGDRITMGSVVLRLRAVN